MSMPWAVMQLARPRISLMVAGAAFFGAMLRHGADPAHVAFPMAAPVVGAVAGAFFTCAGCSALNQIQERGRDALMERTRHRPLPAGRMGVGQAGLVAALLLGLGGVLFFLGGGGRLALVGLVVVLVYNGLYTPLKTRTPLALLVGGTVGAFPPLTGWLAAGGNGLDPRILGVMGLFYLWQTPHFWLLAENHRADYEKAGFPLVAASLPGRVYKPLMALWIMAFFIATGTLLGFMGHGAASPAVFFGTLLAGAATAASAAWGHGKAALAAVNISLALFMAAMLGFAP